MTNIMTSIERDHQIGTKYSFTNSLKLNRGANKKPTQSNVLEKLNSEVWLSNKLPDWPRILLKKKKNAFERIARMSSTSQKLVFDLSVSCKLSGFPPVVCFLNYLMIRKDSIFLLNGRNSSLFVLAVMLLQVSSVQYWPFKGRSENSLYYVSLHFISCYIDSLGNKNFHYSYARIHTYCKMNTKNR